MDLSLGSRYNYDPLTGYFIHSKHQRVAEIIKDYNPELELVWIPPNKRSSEDVKPYTVVHYKKDGSQYPIFHLSEDELDDTAGVVTRLYAGDMSKHRILDRLAVIELAEKADELVRAKEEEDASYERQELARKELELASRGRIHL